MTWLNKYHRGFNRLWLVFTCFPFFIFLLYVLLSEDYKANRYVQYDRRVTNFWDTSKEKSEDIIAAWVQEQWRKDKPWKETVTTEQKVRTPARTNNSRSTTEQKVVEDLSNRPTPSKQEQEIEIPNYYDEALRELEQERAQRSLAPEDRFKRSIVRRVRLMKEAKSFTDKELTTIIDLAVEAEKTYPSRAWKARWRGLGHLLVGFIVFIAIFGFGHGVFCLILWIVRGFQEPRN